MLTPLIRMVAGAWADRYTSEAFFSAIRCRMRSIMVVEATGLGMAVTRMLDDGAPVDAGRSMAGPAGSRPEPASIGKTVSL